MGGRKPVETVELSPSEILLDPNSFRLVTDPMWTPIPDERIADTFIQEDTKRKLHALNSRSDLVDSIALHGWLDVEPLRVRRLATGEWVAVDGNRRLVALESVRSSSGHSPGRPLPALLTAFVSTSSDSANEAAALGHIVTRAHWPPLGKAMWRERHEASTGTPAAGAFPRSSGSRDAGHIALDLTRRLIAIGGHQAPSVMFGQLSRLFQHPSAQAWLFPNGVEDSARREVLLGWFAPAGPRRHSVDDDPYAEEPTEFDWSFDLYSFGRLLANPEVVRQLEAGTRPTELPEVASIHDGRSTTDLRSIIDALRAQRDSTATARAQSAITALRDAIRRAGEEPVEPASTSPWPLLNPSTPVRLRSLTIHRYRGLSNITLSDLRRVNLLVGVNNAGKTTALEAAYLLAHLADPRGLIHTLHARTGEDPERNPELLSRLLDRLELDIEAVEADGRALRLSMLRSPVPPGADLASALPGMVLTAEVAGVKHVTATELSTRRPRRTVLKEGVSAWLAPAVLHSPFVRTDRETLMRCYRASVEAGALRTVIEAIQQSVDPGIVDVRLVSDHGQFVVEHRERPPMDLSAYGEGLQRMFEIGLLFAAHRGGFVLVDEVEVAIHTSALFRFTQLIEKLAATFDVQAVLTTHSKEAVDAFLFNDVPNEDLAVFRLQRDGEMVTARRFEGERLKRAVEVGDVDVCCLCPITTLPIGL